MPSLQLTDDQAETLEAYMSRMLSELNREIAKTDGRAYREGLKRERELLREVAHQLEGLGRRRSA